MGLVKKGEQADALWFGIGVHYSLADWYLLGLKRGPHPAETFEIWCGDEIREIKASMFERDREWYDEPLYEDAKELGVAMLEEYVRQYGKDPSWNVIYVEHPFKVKVTRGGKPIAIFMSTWDGVFRDLQDGRIYLMEHKTAAQIATAYLELDDQGGVYWATAGPVLRSEGILKPDEQIAGICYNFLRKSMPDERPVDAQGQSLNKDGSVSKRQPTAKFVREYVEREPSEQRSQMERLSDEVAVMNAMRQGIIPVTKHTTWMCPRCDFFEMCVLHEKGNDNWKSLARANYATVDPYERYTKSASE
jgi:hypothetical protein